MLSTYWSVLKENIVLSLYHHSFNRVKTKLSPNFKHSMVYLNRTLTRKNGKQIKNIMTATLNEGSLKNNKETHNKDDLQKFHRNEKVGTEEIVDTYGIQYLLSRINKLF